MLESFGSFGVPGSYDYSEEDLENEDSGEIPESSYDYGELSLDSMEEIMA